MMTALAQPQLYALLDEAHSTNVRLRAEISLMKANETIGVMEYTKTLESKNRLIKELESCLYIILIICLLVIVCLCMVVYLN